VHLGDRQSHWKIRNKAKVLSYPGTIIECTYKPSFKSRMNRVLVPVRARDDYHIKIKICEKQKRVCYADIYIYQPHILIPTETQSTDAHRDLKPFSKRFQKPSVVFGFSFNILYCEII
jgi:hypothetical protein